MVDNIGVIFLFIIQKQREAEEFTLTFALFLQDYYRLYGVNAPEALVNTRSYFLPIGCIHLILNLIKRKNTIHKDEGPL